MNTETDNLVSGILASWPSVEWRDVHVVVAVSGGADSVALLRVVHAAKDRVGGAGRLYVAHFDHRLRAESSADAAWVAELSAELQVPCETGGTDVKSAALQQGDGLEAASRLARYGFLAQTAEKVGARFVATAHTSDDQVETVLQRILRGTGIGGLAGIPRTRPLTPSVTLVRPLLGIGREQVVEYLQRISQSYRVDATNADPRFTRNRLRHELLPLLRNNFNSDVDAAIERLASQAEEVQRWIGEEAQRLLTRAATVSPGRVVLDVRRLDDVPPLLVREMCKLAWITAEFPLQSMGYKEWKQLEQMVAGERGEALSMPGNVRVERRGTCVEIAQIA